MCSELSGVSRRAEAGETAGSFETFRVLGIPISVTTLSTAIAAIQDWAVDGRARMVCVRDVHGVMQARNNALLRDLHLRADMVTPDGMPLVWLGRVGGFAVERTCGPDLMDRFMKDTAGSGLKQFLLGGAPGIADELRRHFETKYPGANIVGTHSPPFRELAPEEVKELAAQIRRSGAQVVWIGLSTPKQEFLMDQMLQYSNWTSIAVGAAFDFHSGAVKRAPKWMQSSGLEWSYRLFSEPRRLWRRYLILAPKFVLAVLFGYWRGIVSR